MKHVTDFAFDMLSKRIYGTVSCVTAEARGRASVLFAENPGTQRTYNHIEKVGSRNFDSMRVRTLFRTWILRSLWTRRCSNDLVAGFETRLARQSRRHGQEASLRRTAKVVRSRRLLYMYYGRRFDTPHKQMVATIVFPRSGVQDCNSSKCCIM